MSELALLQPFKTWTPSAIMDSYRHSCLQKAANNHSGGNQPHVQLPWSSTPARGDSWGWQLLQPKWQSPQVRACPWKDKPDRVPHLVSIEDCLGMSNLRSDRCRVKPAQQETTVLQFVCLTPSHSLFLSGEAILGQQNYETPLVQGKVRLQATPTSVLAHTTQPATQAFCWLGQSKVTQPSQNWSG